jgi:hypothetical protein
MKKLNYFILVYCLFALRSIAQETEYRSLFGPSIAVKEAPKHTTVAIPKPNLIDQSQAEVDRKSKGCIDCHNGGHAGDGKVGDPHNSPNVRLGCIDCHGGDATQGLTMKQAHIMPKNPVFFESAANPSDSTVLLNHESSEFIQFVNPGDLRVAKKACGTCHAAEVDNVGHSMMRHGAMLWGAAAYNNGAFYLKDSIFGQAYGENGAPLALKSPIKVTPEMQKEMGIVDTIFPLPRFSISQPGNLFRVFEKGGVKPLELGNPDPSSRRVVPSADFRIVVWAL